MRRLVGVLGALVLAGGSAFAVEGYDDSVRANVGTVHVSRYAFDLAGRSDDDAAAERCAGLQVVKMHRHRTMADVAAAVFTGGWYTPEHVDVQCAPVASAR